MTDADAKKPLALDPCIGAIEIKLTANARDEAAVREAFDAEDVEAERREIYFYDTLGLDLFEAGVVLRARLVRDGADDSTVKLRPVAPERLSDDWKQTEGFEVELDAVGDDAGSAFTGRVRWVQIDLGEDADDPDHRISEEERFRIAMARH